MAVVKVQMPRTVAGDPEPKHALVFEKGRSNSSLVPVSDDLREKMKGRAEAFFKAERVMSWEIGDETGNPHWENEQAKLRGGRP